MSPTTQVTIRPAQPSEFPAIERLARRIWPVCFRDLITPGQCDYMLDQRYNHAAMMEARSHGSIYELIERSQQVLGFGAHGPADSPSDWKLWQIYVLPECQGQGLGRHYIEHVSLHARAQGRTALVLTVNKRNDRARALYERCGFALRESACFDIGNGFVMDDYVMAKPLPPLPSH